MLTPHKEGIQALQRQKTVQKAEELFTRSFFAEIQIAHSPIKKFKVRIIILHLIYSPQGKKY